MSKNSGKDVMEVTNMGWRPDTLMHHTRSVANSEPAIHAVAHFWAVGRNWFTLKLRWHVWPVPQSRLAPGEGYCIKAEGTAINFRKHDADCTFVAICNVSSSHWHGN